MKKSTYEKLAGLSFELESSELSSQSQLLLKDYKRITTTIHLKGGGFEGLGEDVSYDEADQLAFQKSPIFPPSGNYTIDSFSRKLDSMDLFSMRPPSQPAYLDYRRWAFESAALDLALQQNRKSLEEVLERKASPLTFIMSKHLPDPPEISTIEDILEKVPGTRFKLDPTSDWDQAFMDALAKFDAVDCLDLKGQYKGTPVDQPADPEMYKRVVETFPNAWIEDPKLTSETEKILKPHSERVTWDAMIHSVQDIEALPFAPRALNIKPSRFGSIARLLDAYDYCEEKDILMYGGGQSELSIGRDQIQIMAAIFHGENSNDTAPRGYNRVPFETDLPKSPLPLSIAKNRFILE